jgi:hypothetical protein
MTTARKIIQMSLAVSLMASSSLSMAVEKEEGITHINHTQKEDMSRNARRELFKNMWKELSVQHPSLKELSSQELANVLNTWGKKIAKILGCDATLREVDDQAIEKFIKVLEQVQDNKEKNIKIWMLSGKQESQNELETQCIEIQRIQKMRLPDNEKASLTRTSFIELFQLAVISKYIKETMQRDFSSYSVVVESSENKRANIPANVFARALSAKRLINQNLNCVNYLPEEMLSTSEILKWLPDGLLPWEKEKVDAVVGEGIYEQINLAMEEIITRPYSEPTLHLLVTHLEQLHAVSKKLGLELAGFNSFGFMIVASENKEIFINGFFK